MRSPNRPSDSTATWTPEHLGTFVEQVGDDRYFALWMLVATTGVRLEALTGLLRQEVDIDKGRISPSPVADPDEGRTVRGSHRYVLDPTAYDVLKEHVAAWEMERLVLRHQTQKLFVWSNGEQIDAGAVRTMFRQHCSLAGLPVVPLHAMRQAYVVAAIDSGIPVKGISQRLSRSVEPQPFGASQGVDMPAAGGGAQRIVKSHGGSWSCRSRNY